LKLLKHIPAFLKNKFLLAGVGFLVLMFFFDSKDFAFTYGQVKKLKNLQQSELHLTKQIDDTRKELDLLKTNAQTIEKYAREKYLMKKDNEDLFIVLPVENAK
jgi:cell division protein DivIC